MLYREQSANETFSSTLEPGEEFFRDEGAPHHHVRGARDRPAVAPGDEVVFERLDLAEILGIWRHARGRVVGIHLRGGDATTVDVKFEGHETLERYLPDLFRRVH